MVLLFFIAIGVAIIWMYNLLIGAQNGVQNAFGALDAMLKKRFDLIPNLVEVAKQYAGYEQGTLTKLTELRARAQSGTLSAVEKNELSRQVSSVMVTMENYPELRANENFMQLQRSLNETEEQIAAARRNYNSVITTYNNRVMMFPTNIFASILGFTPKNVLETAENERQNVDVKQLFQ
jgi:LemA protein